MSCARLPGSAAEQVQRPFTSGLVDRWLPLPTGIAPCLDRCFDQEEAASSPPPWMSLTGGASTRTVRGLDGDLSSHVHAGFRHGRPMEVGVSGRCGNPSPAAPTAKH